MNKPCILFFVFSISTLITNSSSAQDSAKLRLPEYAIAYSLPKLDDIQAILHKVRAYYESTGIHQVLDAETGMPIIDYAKINKGAKISNGFHNEWSYTNGVVMSAFSTISEELGDKQFYNNNELFFDFVLKTLPYFRKNQAQFGKSTNGWSAILEMDALDDCGSIAAAMIKTYRKNGNKAYLEIINQIADFISNKQFRLEDGTLARHRPQYQSIWADDMYMSVPFLANMGALTGQNKYFDDAIRQILQMSDRLYNPQKELYDHGWNQTSGSYDPHFYWGRANGWALMAMAELLDLLPDNYSGRDKVLHLYRSVIRSVTGLQDGSGFWHNLLDKTDTYLETSCTAMFTYAIAKGINKGWVSHIYGPVALTGWNAIQTRVLSNGAVDGTCEATTFASDNVYYYNRPKTIYATHGYGPVLFAGIEMIRLLKNQKIEILPAKSNSLNSTFHFILKQEWPK